MRSVFFVFIFALLLASYPAKACPLARPIVIAGLDYESARFASEFLLTILHQGFGCDAKVVEKDLPYQIDDLKEGKADILMEVWADNPNKRWVQAEKEGSVIMLGVTFGESDEGWFVPRYLVEGPNAPAPDLRWVRDLRSYAELFNGELLNCPPAWNCNPINKKKLKAYGLDPNYRSRDAIDDADLHRKVSEAYIQGKAILFYGWNPDILSNNYEFVKLKEPNYNQKIWDELVNSSNPTAACEYPRSVVHIGANKAFIDEVPDIKEFLTKWRIGTSDISTALIETHLLRLSPSIAANEFLRKRPDIWMPWFSDDVIERLEAALK
jgi:glycine betaine/proline transport system substrate-binding protein